MSMESSGIAGSRCFIPTKCRNMETWDAEGSLLGLIPLEGILGGEISAGGKMGATLGKKLPS